MIDDKTVDQAAKLWRWFAAHADEVAAGADSAVDDLPPVLARLDRLVSGIGDGLSWEIGPWLGGWFLALSPGGSPKRLQLTADLVGLATAVSGWTFFPARPPKEWSRRFVFGGRDVDASRWRYRLRRWDDGALGIIWGFSDDICLDDGDMEKLGWFVLESEVGEERVIRQFADVEMACLSSWSDQSSGGHIEVLRQHVEALLDDDSR